MNNYFRFLRNMSKYDKRNVEKQMFMRRPRSQKKLQADAFRSAFNVKTKFSKMWFNKQMNEDEMQWIYWTSSIEYGVKINAYQLLVGLCDCKLPLLPWRNLFVSNAAEMFVHCWPLHDTKFFFNLHFSSPTFRLLGFPPRGPFYQGAASENISATSAFKKVFCCQFASPVKKDTTSLNQRLYTRTVYWC